MRSLEGALIRLVAYTSLTGEPATPDVAHKVLGGLASHARLPCARRPSTRSSRPRPRPSTYAEAIEAPGRKAQATFARQVAMYLAESSPSESLAAIGADFGGRRHATVLDACRKIEREIAERAQARELVDSLKARLGGQG